MGTTAVDPLARLVAAGTITEDQEVSVVNAFLSAIKAYQTQFDTAKSGMFTNSMEISV